MLNGNICRVCVSGDINEINSAKAWAIKRINAVANFRIERLSRR